MNWVTGIRILGNSACVSWVVSWLELGFWEIQLAFLGWLVDWNRILENSACVSWVVRQYVMTSTL